MSKLPLLLVGLVLLLVIHDVSCKKQDKKQQKYQKEGKVEGYSGEAKGKYSKQHNRQTRSASKEGKSKKPQQEEQQSFVTEKAKKEKSKTPVFDDPGVPESTCECQKETQQKAAEAKNKKKRYILVEETEIVPEAQEQELEAEPSVVEEPQKKGKKTKQIKDKKGSRKVAAAEEASPVEDELEQPTSKKSKKERVYVAVEEEPTPEDEVEVIYVQPRHSNKSSRLAAESNNENEAENATGKRRNVEQVQEDVPLEEEEEI